MAQTPRLGLVLLAAAQAQKHVTHNDALASLDGLVQASVIASDTASPPATPAEGDAYLVSSTPLATAGFAGQALALAYFINGAWRFMPPQNGWLVFVRSTSAFVVFYGGVWHSLDDCARSLANLQRFGLGTTADGYNRFAIKSNAGYFAALSTGEGGSGDFRLTLNKAQSGNTVSCLFQNNWSGRAELGLTGDDSWRVKVSADGNAWQDVLVADPSSGAVRIDRLISGRAQPRLQACVEAEFGDGGKQGVAINATGTATATGVSFSRAGTQIGSISLASGSVAYNTVSDYRLKQVVGGIDEPINKVRDLQPLRYVFKEHPAQIRQGFLAHQVADVVPEAVQGDKDAMGMDGRPVYQQLDQTCLIPLLVAALQEVIGRLDYLETHVDF
jgi:Protein of unknown function (DUF2793)/Chaperone of endosialidase